MNPDDKYGCLALEIEVGRRRIITIAADKVVGFGTTLHGLSDEASLIVQRAGIGGRQRMGCAVFGPVTKVRMYTDERRGQRVTLEEQ